MPSACRACGRGCPTSRRSSAPARGAVARHARAAGGDGAGGAVCREPRVAVRAAEHHGDRPAADDAVDRPAGLVVRRRQPVPGAVRDRPDLPGGRHRHERRGRPHRADGRPADHEHLPRLLERRRGDRRPDRHRLPQGPGFARLASPDPGAGDPAAGAVDPPARCRASPQARRPAASPSRCRRGASSPSASSCSAR